MKSLSNILIVVCIICNFFMCLSFTSCSNQHGVTEDTNLKTDAIDEELILERYQNLKDTIDSLNAENNGETTAKTEEDTTTESDSPDILYLNQLDDLYGYTVVDIGPFYNGIARYEINTTDVIYGDTKYEDCQYGYVDKNGQVKILPIYSDAPEKYENPAFVEYNKNGKSYVGFDIDDYNYWEFGFEGNMEKFGTSSNGLFWVLSCEEQLSGDVYSMTYYDHNGKKIRTFANADYIVDHDQVYDKISDSYINDSNINDLGYALLKIDKKGEIIDKQCNIVDFSYGGNASEDYTKFCSYKDMYGKMVTFNAKYIDIDFRYLTGNIACANISFNVTEKESGESYTSTIKGHVWLDYSSKTVKLIDDYCRCINATFKVCGDNYVYHATSGWKQCDLINKDGDILYNILEHPDFSGAEVNSFNVSKEGIVVNLRNSNGSYFSTILDSNGNIQMTPSNKIWTYNGSATVLNNGLCVAQDTSTGLYGYIDATGKWAIQPQFTNAESFSEGLAFVDNTKIIDKSGNTVFYIN